MSSENDQISRALYEAHRREGRDHRGRLGSSFGQAAPQGGLFTKDNPIATAAREELIGRHYEEYRELLDKHHRAYFGLPETKKGDK